MHIATQNIRSRRADGTSQRTSFCPQQKHAKENKTIPQMGIAVRYRNFYEINANEYDRRHHCRFCQIFAGTIFHI